MTAKAESGRWPSAAPTGFRNVRGNDQSIVPDENAPLIRELFALAATGTCSAQELTRRARAMGLKTRRGGSISKNWVLAALKNRVYVGRVVWGGKEYDGRHEPIVSWSLFAAVQAALGRPRTKARHTQPFNALVRCAGCNGLLGSDEKMKRLASGTVARYRYLHCNGRGNCGRKHYREEFFDVAIGTLLQSIAIDGRLSAWVEEQLGAWHDAQNATTAETAARIDAQIARIEQMREDAFVEKLSGKVDDGLWEKFDRKWRDDIDRLRSERDATRLLPPRPAFLAAARRPIELLQRAPALWVTRAPHEKALLAKTLLIELRVQGGTCSPVYRKPFDALAKGSETGNWWS